MVKSYQGARASESNKKIPLNISVKEYMSTNLTTFLPTDSISKVIDILTSKRISGAPVVDSTGTVVGIISEVDCLKEVVKGKYNNTPSFPATVDAYMTKNVITLSIDANIFDAATKFQELKIRRFPILNEGKLVGQISISDILRAFSELHATNW